MVVIMGGGNVVSSLKVIVPDNFKDFGEKVNNHIKNIREVDENFIVDTDLIRFGNGEGKAVIKESIRNKDLYILSDVSNYDISYSFFGRKHYMSPDEHFMDIKRILSAECGHASKRTVILPYLYQSRQDKKENRESLDCAIALRELVNMGVNELITCDVHNRAISNAISNDAFESVMLGDVLLLDLIMNEKIDNFNKFICVAPDEGAMKRARFFSGLLGNVEIGNFYKQRDYTKVVNGKNPIIAHVFNGPNDLTSRYAVISDDMIASGGSILDTALHLHKLGAEKIYLIVSFALFTEGIDKFDEYYEKGIIDRVYASNVSYVPDYIQNKEWFKSVDCSYKIANIISELNYGNSIGDLIDGRTETAIKIRKLRKEK